MSQNNKTYGIESANKTLAQVFRDEPGRMTRNTLADDVTAIIYTGLQVTEKRGEVIANYREAKLLTNGSVPSVR